MPTLLIINGLRFFFYSNENNEPAHVHITKAGSDGKVWLEPVIKVEYMYGFTIAETKDILKIITLNYETFLQKWYEYFNQ